MPEKEFKRMTRTLLSTTEKQIHEIKKPIHNTDEKFCYEKEIVKTNQTEITEMKKSTHQIGNPSRMP